MWSGLVLLLSPAAFVGGLSTSAEAQCVSVSPISSSTPGDTATITNNECITASGTNEDGIRSAGADATITNFGTITKSGGDGYGISSSGANANITNSGTVTAAGMFRDGISSIGGNATIIITNSGTVTTDGRFGDGISSEGLNATITNSGRITTSGSDGTGISSIGGNATITITNSGTITTSGRGARGIASTGVNATITNSGIITTSGSNGNGIFSDGANADVTNSGTIATTGGAGHGIRSTGASAVIHNTGSMTTRGVNAQGIRSFGDDARIRNSGTITTFGDRNEAESWSSRGIWSSGARATIVNSGMITTRGVEGNGIELTGSDAAVTNSGTIAATFHGILVENGGAMLSNSGTITAGAGFFGIRVNGAGSVGTLVNAQGGAAPLTYSGALPATYTVIVRSLSSFGQLAVTSPSGSMTFGVDPLSALASNRYTDVLTGVSAEAITNEETLFSLGGFAWRLSAGSAADSWDLLVLPDIINTQLGLQSNASAVRGVLGQRAASTAFALDYDCSVFDQHGFCVSVGFRNTQMGSNYADSGETAGLLSAAYRVTQELRIGGFIDQGLVSQSPVGVDPKNTQPMLGAFAVYQENPDFSGFMIRAALAHQEGDLRITRPELENTEPGTGRARTSALAFGGEVAYGFPVDSGWVAQPYLGLRRSDSQRQGYTETTSDSVEFPITYNRFGQQVTSATAGLRLRGAITPQFSLTFGAGVEYDLDSKMYRYAGTSAISGMETFSVNAGQQQNETRAVGSAGMRYMIASNQALGFDASVRQMPYGNDPAITTMLRYSIGF